MRSRTGVVAALGAAALAGALAAPASADGAGGGRVTRLSTDGGRQLDLPSGMSEISANGRYVAFLSDADDLVEGDTNGFGDVFRLDRRTGEVVRVNVSATGEQANADLGESWTISISADGRYVAFASRAGNLVENDGNGTDDVFVKDVESGRITRVSEGTGGVEADGASFEPSISAGGRYVAYQSVARNISDTRLPGDGAPTVRTYVTEVATGRTQLVSLSSDEAPSNAGTSGAALSGDGRFVAFESDATNLVAGDTNGRGDVFVRDLERGTTRRVSVSSRGAQAARGAWSPSISADGRYVAFVSESPLVAGDRNREPDVYVRDRRTDWTVPASLAPHGAWFDGMSFSPDLSADGSTVAFLFRRANPDRPGEYVGHDHVFVRDLGAQTTTLVSHDRDGGRADDSSMMPDVDRDGGRVTFTSRASDLVRGDTNDMADVFLWRRSP